MKISHAKKICKLVQVPTNTLYIDYKQILSHLKWQKHKESVRAYPNFYYTANLFVEWMNINFMK